MRSTLRRPVFIGALSLSLVAGCQSPPAPVPTPETVPVDPAAVATAAPAQDRAIAGLLGSADINGVPFADADVKIFRPGQDQPVAIGKTGPDGRFSITLGSVIAPGGGNVIAVGGGNVIAPGGGNVIAPGGGNVIAPGGGNVIAPGGGNVIAPGGGNVIAPGGGNVIAPGGGNVIAVGGGNVIAVGGGNLTVGAPLKVVASKDGASLAAIATAGVIAVGGGNVIAPGGGNVIAVGGGNVIAAGGLNYRVAQQAAREVRLTATTTLAVIALGKRLEGALDAVESKDGRVLEQALNTVLEAYNKVAESVADTLIGEAGDRLVGLIVKALDADGKGELPPAVQQQITRSDNDFRSTFVEAAKALGAAITEAVSSGGDRPATTTTDAITFGDVAAPPVTPISRGSGGSSTSTPPPIAVSVGGSLSAPGQIGPTASPKPIPSDFSSFNVASFAAGHSFAKYGHAIFQDAPSPNHLDYFYAIGGTTDGSAVGTANARQTVKLMWGAGALTTVLGSNLLQGRLDHASIEAFGDIWVFGGRPEGASVAPLPSIERIARGELGDAAKTFTDKDADGLNLPAMGLPVFGHALAAANFGSYQAFYITGGRTNSTVVKQTQTVKVTAGKLTNWSTANPLLTQERYGHVALVTSVGTTPKYLYVIGGRNASATLNSVERIEITATGALSALGWKPQPVTFVHPQTGAVSSHNLSLTDYATGADRGRFGMSAVVKGDHLYVFGGLRVNGANVGPVEFCDRARIDPLTGELGPFYPHHAEFLYGRGHYGVGLTSSGDALVVGGTPGQPGSMPNPFLERALWR